MHALSENLNCKPLIGFIRSAHSVVVLADASLEGVLIRAHFAAFDQSTFCRFSPVWKQGPPKVPPQMSFRRRWTVRLPNLFYGVMEELGQQSQASHSRKKGYIENTVFSWFLCLLECIKIGRNLLAELCGLPVVGELIDLMNLPLTGHTSPVQPIIMTLKATILHMFINKVHVI
ncbi:hypothetical protein V8G54_026770 [Vigna mungo]|uniref:Uncharacterized protein n=1 Tax=Vigna mungo TaxID=3915 RepID=A0AAQ3N0Y9_VIGMU